MVQCCDADKSEPRRDVLELVLSLPNGHVPILPRRTRRARHGAANFLTLIIRRSLLAQFEKLLPLAAKWVEAVEARILREGVPLSEQELADARAIGVREPERVRLLALDCVPTPADLTLKTAAAAIQFLTPATRGLALRYGIFVRSDCWRDRRLIAHELAHTGQYERLGGIEPFLRQYLRECLTIGYPEGPMEQEAIAAASRLDVCRPA